MNCKNCGANNKEGAKFCEYCGTSLPKPQEPQAPVTVIINNNVGSTPEEKPQPQSSYTSNYSLYDYLPAKKSKGTVFIICLLFGWLGMHKFYVNKSTEGVLYLLTFGLFGLGRIIDIIKILNGNFTDKWNRKLTE